LASASETTKKAVAKKGGEASRSSRPTSGDSSSRGTSKSSSGGRRRTTSGTSGNANNNENIRSTGGDGSQYEGSNISTGSQTPEGVTGSGMREDDDMGGLATDRDASGTNNVDKD